MDESAQAQKNVAHVMNAAEFLAAFRDAHRPGRSLHDRRNDAELQRLQNNRGGSVTSDAEAIRTSASLTCVSPTNFGPPAAISSR